jgi:hypothetical protein
MKSTYFPYTYISNPLAEAVGGCCGKFTVYQPLSDKLPLTMQPWVDKGVIDIRLPVSGANREVESATENYLNWANLHAGSSGPHRASLKTLKASAKGLDTSLSSQIMADVKKQINGNTTAKSSDPVLSARIFLYLAQNFDQQSQEVENVLAESRKKELDLIQDLKREKDPLAAEFTKETDHIPKENTDYLIDGRLEAWTRLLLQDREPSCFFVTHSTAILGQLLDNAPKAEKIFDFGAIPATTLTTVGPAPWREQLISFLSYMAENKWPAVSGKRVSDIDIPAAENTVSLKIYVVPDQNPPHVFCRGAGIKGPDSDLTGPTGGDRNTLIGLVGQ